MRPTVVTEEMVARHLGKTREKRNKNQQSIQGFKESASNISDSITAFVQKDKKRNSINSGKDTVTANSNNTSPIKHRELKTNIN